MAVSLSANTCRRIRRNNNKLPGCNEISRCGFISSKINPPQAAKKQAHSGILILHHHAIHRYTCLSAHTSRARNTSQASWQEVPIRMYHTVPLRRSDASSIRWHQRHLRWPSCTSQMQRGVARRLRRSPTQPFNSLTTPTNIINPLPWTLPCASPSSSRGWIIREAPQNHSQAIL